MYCIVACKAAQRQNGTNRMSYRPSPVCRRGGKMRLIAFIALTLLGAILSGATASRAGIASIAAVGATKAPDSRSSAQTGFKAGAQMPAQLALADSTPRLPSGPNARSPESANGVSRPGFAAPPRGETRFLPGEVVLSTRPDVPVTTLIAIASRNRLTRMGSQDSVLTGMRFYRWRIDSGATVAATIRSLVREPLVISAQPNYIYQLQKDRAVEPPTNPDEDLQYALGNLDIPPAHRLATGKGVLIALIDSEVDASHPDLEGSVSAKFDTTGIELVPHRHGTAMAGAIASHDKLTGTAPQASLLAVRAFGGTEAGEDGTTFRILQGLNWAADHHARIINMSFAGPADPGVQEALAAAHARGIVLVAASGNTGPKSAPLYPAAERDVLAVTAVDARDGWFALATRGKHLAVAAPGVDVLVPAPDAGYGVTSGTSVAAAEVSGIVALMLERAPTLSPDDVRMILMETAKHLGNKGRNPEFGAGLVDAARAVEIAPIWSRPAAMR
jgi:subtilisin family serine protease